MYNINKNLSMYSHHGIVNKFYFHNQSDKYIWDFFNTIMLKDYSNINSISNKDKYDAFYLQME